MTSNIASLKTRVDPWQDAFEAMALKHRLLPVDNLVLLDKIIEMCPHKKEYNVRTYVVGDQTVRVLQLIDKYDRVINQWDNLELIDGKLYMRVPYRPRVSWFEWLTSRFYAPRGPTVNVHVRR
jgi:hypothetical protein